jgi:hypothetical protein
LSERALSDRLAHARPDELGDLKRRLAEVEGRMTVGKHSAEGLIALEDQAAAIRTRIRRLQGGRR